VSLEVGLDHHLHQRVEANGGLPSEALPRLRRIADEQVDFGRPIELRVVGDPAKAKRELGWEPQTNFEELIRLMVRADLELLSK
jgi:GDP-D-mannose dehydratase